MNLQEPKSTATNRNHQEVSQSFDRVAENARKADALIPRHIFQNQSYREVDSHDGRPVEILGSALGDYSVNRRGNGQEISVIAEQKDENGNIKKVFSSTSESGKTGSLLMRPGTEKPSLHTDSPLVFKMLANSALKSIDRKSKGEIESANAHSLTQSIADY